MSVSVALATAITSHARLIMYPFKTIENNKALYSDTDSILLENPLLEEYVSETRLSAFKTVATGAECIFLAPKIAMQYEDPG